MSFRKLAIIVGLIIALGVGMYFWLGKSKKEAPVAAMPEMTYVVETSIVTPRPQFLVERRYIGTIKAEKFSLLAPKMAGTVASIDVEAGQKVKKGQLLFSLSGTSEVRSVELAEKSLKLAQEKLARNRVLYQSQDITKSQLDEAEAEVLSANTRLESQRQNKEKVEIRAPFDGVVGVPRVALGETVQPDNPIISVMDGPFSITINIPSSRLAEVMVGQRVRLKSGNTTIAAVERSIDPTTRTGFAKAMLASCKDCIIGDSVYALIGVHEKENALLITRNAIFYKDQKAHVVVVQKTDEGKLKAAIKEVSVGEEQEGEVEILSGLKEGDEIIIANPKRIPDQANLSVLK